MLPSVFLFLLQIFQIASFHVTSRCRATEKLNPHDSSRGSSTCRPASSLSYNYFALVLRANTVDDTYNENYDDRLISEIPVEKRGIGVGIDLGTTNSAIAILQASKNATTATQQLVGLSFTVSPKILSIPNNGRTMPSIVSILPNNHDEDNKDHPKKIVVGKEAAQLEHEFPESSYRNVKRIIGTGGKKSDSEWGVSAKFLFRKWQKGESWCSRYPKLSSFFTSTIRRCSSNACQIILVVQYILRVCDTRIYILMYTSNIVSNCRGGDGR